MRSLAFTALLGSFTFLGIAQFAQAQGYYNQTAVRNPVTGRQQVIDYQAPRWTGAGQGGFMFDGGSGSLQVTAVRRSRFTGRLEYFNQYMNPWTGARYTTATQFNPFSGRYESVHNFLPPPQRKKPNEAAEASSTRIPRRGIRVIETPLPQEESPAEVAPPVELSGEPSDEAAVLEEPAVSEEPAQPPTTVEIRTPKIDEE